MSAPRRRLRDCVEAWPQAETGGFDPRCCRFPKSCSATVHDDGAVTEDQPEPEPQLADVPLLKLVRQYGDARDSARAAAHVAGYDLESEGHRRAADALLDRITTLLAQQPVQARNEAGVPLVIHACGYVSREDASGVAEGEHYRFPSCPTPGPWSQLLVGGDPAPEAVVSAPLRERDQLRSLLADANTLMAQVMAELGVDGPEDMMDAVKRLRTERDGWASKVTGYRQQRDAALAEAERLNVELTSLSVVADGLTEQRDTVRAQRDEARAELANARQQRNAAVDKVRELQAQQPDPSVLSLPEVPEGAVALVGQSGQRYEWDAEDGRWFDDDENGCYLYQILGQDGPVRVEMAPPREPHTAAEIWARTHASIRANTDMPRDLRKALDRDASRLTDEPDGAR